MIAIAASANFSQSAADFGQAAQDPFSYFLSMGVTGIFCFLFIKGIIPSPGEMKRVLIENERLRGKLDEVQDTMVRRVLPAVLEANRLMDAKTAETSEESLTRQLREARRTIDEMNLGLPDTGRT